MNEISLSSSAIARKLGIAAFLLILASTLGQLERYLVGLDYLDSVVNVFYLDNEQNIPTYFSMLLMLVAALLLAAIATLNGRLRAPFVSKWAILSFGFLLMGFDEVCQIHERLTVPIRTSLGDGNLGILYFSWVIPGVLLVLLLGLSFLRFLLSLPVKTRRNFLLAATMYLGGAIGLELAGGWYVESHGKENLTYSVLVTVEESLEIAGLVVFIWALLKYFEDNFAEVHCRFASSRHGHRS